MAKTVYIESTPCITYESLAGAVAAACDNDTHTPAVADVMDSVFEAGHRLRR